MLITILKMVINIRLRIPKIILINSYYFDKEISIDLINIRLEQEKQIENLLSNLNNHI